MGVPLARNPDIVAGLAVLPPAVVPLRRQLRLAAGERLGGPRPRELMSDSERIIPGDGDFQLGPVIDFLRRVGYSGYISLELMNPQFWPIAPQQVGEIGLTALRMLLGQSSGGVARDYLPG